MKSVRDDRRILGGALLRLAAIALLATSSAIQAQDDDAKLPPELANLKFVDGPGKGDMNHIAQIEMMAGYRFANGDDTRTLMQLMGNLINGTEVGYLEPVGDNLDSHWFIVFEYDDIGYVKDDEKDSLDANALLKSIRESNDYGNKERKKLGLPAMSIVGWAQPPRYDVETQNLVWAPLIESEGSQVVNYNTRRLGRRGVMSVTLVCDPEDLDKVVPEFNRVMTGFSYKPGQTYSEFKSGDKIAEYGLTALVTGGAVAIAAKSGLLKYGWKLIVAAVAGIGALFKKIFGGGSQSAA